MNHLLYLPIALLADASTASGGGGTSGGVPGAGAGGSRLFTGDPSAVGRHAMEDGSRLDPTWIIPVAGVFMVLFSALSLVSFYRRHRRDPHPLQIYNRLAKGLGLGRRDRLLLWRIARATGLPDPIALMLCPVTLRHHARDLVQPFGRTHAAAVLHRVASVRRRLFPPPILAP